MQYAFHIVDVFSPTPFGGVQLAVLPGAAEFDFARAPSVGTACALVMQQHVSLGDPVRLILEENIGPVTVDVARRNGGFHGTLTLTEKIEAPNCLSPFDPARCLDGAP